MRLGGREITKAHTNLFPRQGVCTKVEAAPKGKQIKVLNIQGLRGVGPTGKSLNPHFRTESALLFNLNKKIKKNPQSVLTPGQEERTRFFSSPFKYSLLCLGYLKKQVGCRCQCSLKFAFSFGYIGIPNTQRNSLDCRSFNPETAPFIFIPNSDPLHCFFLFFFFNRFICKHPGKYGAPAAGELICTIRAASCGNRQGTKLDCSASRYSLGLISTLDGRLRERVARRVLKLLDWHLIFTQNETVCPCLPLGSANPDYAF